MSQDMSHLIHKHTLSIMRGFLIPRSKVVLSQMPFINIIAPITACHRLAYLSFIVYYLFLIVGYLPLKCKLQKGKDLAYLLSYPQFLHQRPALSMNEWNLLMLS